MKSGAGEITVHFLIRNEECFIGPAIRSILPMASRVMVYDTGSTDQTLEIVSSIQDEKIKLVRKEGSSRQDLTLYRNEMMDRTETEWAMLVDGDEVYPSHAVERIREEIRKIPSSVDRIVLGRRHFVRSLNYISRTDRIGRIFRTQRVRFFLKDDWYQTAVLREDSSVTFKKVPSTVFQKDVHFFHFQFFRRSSRDSELGNRRAWRRAPFPVFPYFGPWPEGIKLDGAVDRMTPTFLMGWARMNGRLLGGWFRQKIRKILHKLRGAPPVPGGIQ